MGNDPGQSARDIITPMTADATTRAASAVQAVLTTMAGTEATPRPGQVDAVAALLSANQRVLVVQATGWGKSAVYWAATLARRDEGAGPTIVISPLLALMRDQVAAAERVGIRAATVNSANRDDWDLIFDELARDAVDVLLVSPERLTHPDFMARAMPALRSSGLLVIDEAHCISDWGFDFRPDYQRIAKLLVHLDASIPVLATTATATSRVIDDLTFQLGPTTKVIRGPLARRSLSLAVVPGLNAVERFAWVADAIGEFDGSGIIYGLTIDGVHALAAFLREEGHEVEAYTGQTPPDIREQIEARLRANDLKAVVATSALGMGYDKPDLAFCLHVGSPNSPVAYYQQVGRAGRALESAVGVLLPAAESDQRIWDYFITATLPDPQEAQRVLTLLAERPMSTVQLESQLNRPRSRVEILLKQLHVDAAVSKSGSTWELGARPWEYDEAKYDRVIRLRRREAEIMSAYARAERCLMQLLIEALDDPAAQPCGTCSVCTGRLPKPGTAPDPSTVQRALAAMRRRPNVLEPRKRWPTGGPWKGKIVGMEKGRAIVRGEASGWDHITDGVEQADGPLGTDFQQAVRDVLSDWRREGLPAIGAVVPMPNLEHPRRVSAIAELAAGIVGAPVREVLSASPLPGPPSQPSLPRVRELEQSLSLLGSAPRGVVLLVDESTRTRWGLTVAAHLLTSAGTAAVVPFAAFHGN